MDITKWINVPGVIFYLFIFPGLMYIWSAKGFKEKRQVYYWFMDAFMVGLLLFTFLIALWASLSWLTHQKEDFINLTKGLAILVFRGVNKLLEEPIPISFVTLYVIFATYSLCIISGFLTRLSKEGRFPPWKKVRKPKIFIDSFLDTELMKLREKKIVPQIILTMKSGEIIRGICYSYTFTAPREIAIDLYGDMQMERHIVIAKLDDNVDRLEIVFTEPSKEKKSPFSIVKKITHGR